MHFTLLLVSLGLVLPALTAPVSSSNNTANGTFSELTTSSPLRDQLFGRLLLDCLNTSIEATKDDGLIFTLIDYDEVVKELDAASNHTSQLAKRGFANGLVKALTPVAKALAHAAKEHGGEWSKIFVEAWHILGESHDEPSGPKDLPIEVVGVNPNYRPIKTAGQVGRVSSGSDTSNRDFFVIKQDSYATFPSIPRNITPGSAEWTSTVALVKKAILRTIKLSGDISDMMGGRSFVVLTANQDKIVNLVASLPQPVSEASINSIVDSLAQDLELNLALGTTVDRVAKENSQ